MHIWRSVYEQIREEQEEVYRNQKFPIIKEYQHKSIFPPPFSLLFHFFDLVYYLYKKRKEGKVDSNQNNPVVKNKIWSSIFAWVENKNFFGLNLKFIIKKK